MNKSLIAAEVKSRILRITAGVLLLGTMAGAIYGPVFIENGTGLVQRHVAMADCINGVPPHGNPDCSPTPTPS